MTYQGSRSGWMTHGNVGRSTRLKTARRKWRGKALRRLVMQSKRDWDRGNPRGGHNTTLPLHRSLRLQTNQHNRDEPDMAHNPHRSTASRERGAAAQRAKRGGSKTPSAEAILNRKAKARQRYKQNRTINRMVSHSNMHQRGKCELHPIYHNGQNMAVTNNNLPMFAWDHLDRTTKKDTIAKLIDTSTPNAIQTEIDKCQLVCHNCHAMKTKENKDWVILATYTNPHQPTLF